MFHLGDYIYEDPGDPDGGAHPHAHGTGDRRRSIDYRNRYAQYRTDPDLQAAHAAFPFIVTWDDHEVDNNYAGDVSGAQRAARDAFLARRAAAYQAYYEHMPLRRASIPKGPTAAALSAVRVRHARVVLRARHAAVPERSALRRPAQKTPCPEMADPKATLLGESQEKWLFGGLGASPRTLERAAAAGDDGQGRPADARRSALRYSTDQWSGYDVERTRVLDFLGTRKPSNPIVLTGDIHSNWVNDLKVDFTDPKSPVVGDGVRRARRSRPAATAWTSRRRRRRFSTENPFVKFHNTQRGYVSVEVTARSMRADYQIVEYVTRPGAPKRTRASFVVEDGRPGAVRMNQ